MTRTIERGAVRFAVSCALGLGMVLASPAPSPAETGTDTGIFWRGRVERHVYVARSAARRARELTDGRLSGEVRYPRCQVTPHVSSSQIVVYTPGALYNLGQPMAVCVDPGPGADATARRDVIDRLRELDHQGWD
jgi:hypothetical protein